MWSFDLPHGFPTPRIPEDNPITPAKVELGRRLFYDTRLSGNGRQSCATCHVQALAFTDGRGRAIGSTGEVHPRGSMSLVNIAYASALTWGNPAIHRREDQARAPMFGTEPVELGLTAPGDAPNTGLFEVTRDPADVGKFKAPTLRNIAVTAPYMHDGSIETLDGVIDHYSAGGRTLTQGPYAGIGRDNPNKSETLRGFQLTPGQRAGLIEFLNSLTDTALLSDPRFSDPGWQK